MPGEKAKLNRMGVVARWPTNTQEDVYAKLKHLFVFHKDSGACLLYKPFTPAKFDPQLIAGFISAISTFGDNFSKNSRLKTLDYQDFKILLEETSHCRHALLFQGNQDETLQRELDGFIREFETTYAAQIISFRGEISVFREARSIAERIFVPGGIDLSISDRAPAVTRDEGDHVFHLYCPKCNHWHVQAPNTYIWGSETCEECHTSLMFVPKCSVCGNKFARPAIEFNEFKQRNPPCEKCGGVLHIQ
jgi:hypothetical protein